MMTRRRILLFVGLILLVTIATGAWQFDRLSRFSSAYAAKIAGSGVFVAGRDLESLYSQGELDSVWFITCTIDEDSRSLTASIGPYRRTAQYSASHGCTLVSNVGSLNSTNPEVLSRLEDESDDPRPWPLGDGQLAESRLDETSQACLESVLDDAFREPGESLGARRTRAVVVVHHGQIVAEKYAEGFGPYTPQLGWSMSKSVTAALVGIRVADGKLDLQSPIDVPEWTSPDDPRQQISLEHLLQMTSGLQWQYSDGPFSDEAQMTFLADDCAAYAAVKRLIATPGHRHHYSTGNTNIICRALRDTFDNDETYLAWPRKVLFDRIGMRHAIIETDPSGTLMGGTFCWASARDWARFGLLYLNDGVWNGEQILPEGWVDYCRTPSNASPKGHYGAHWWCNAGRKGNADKLPHPQLPPDYYVARGHQGQSIGIIPSRDLVVVRLGLTEPHEAFHEPNFVASVLKCFP